MKNSVLRFFGHLQTGLFDLLVSIQAMLLPFRLYQWKTVYSLTSDEFHLTSFGEDWLSTPQIAPARLAILGELDAERRTGRMTASVIPVNSEDQTYGTIELFTHHFHAYYEREVRTYCQSRWRQAYQAWLAHVAEGE
ncbi:MAG: hypothetical protein SF029_12615 [bacterium]|nr:hypothetical protein [bacterium]